MQLHQLLIINSVYIHFDLKRCTLGRGVCTVCWKKYKDTILFCFLFYIYVQICILLLDTGAQTHTQSNIWLTDRLLRCPVAWCVTDAWWSSLMGVLVENAVFLTVSTIDSRNMEGGAGTRGDKSCRLWNVTLCLSLVTARQMCILSRSQ